jgi:hypothetical protein
VANRSGVVLTLNHDSCFVRNGSVTQAWALKVRDLTGATGNRCGSNRYRERSAGAGVRSPGRVAELWHASPLRLRTGRHERPPVSGVAPISGLVGTDLRGELYRDRHRPSQVVDQDNQRGVDE